MKQGLSGQAELNKIELLMHTLNIAVDRRAVVPAALNRAEITGKPAAAIQLPDGTVVTGRTSELLGASSAVLLNALKVLAGISHSVHLISPTVIEPIQTLKTDYMQSRNPRLHTDEMLVALAISAATDGNAMKAMQALDQLNGCDVHSTVILSGVDDSVFKKLGMNFTYDPVKERK